MCGEARRKHWDKSEPKSSVSEEPGFESLIGDDAVGTLQEFLHVSRIPLNLVVCQRGSVSHGRPRA